jgi:hypothetical protein
MAFYEVIHAVLKLHELGPPTAIPCADDAATMTAWIFR